MSTDREKDKKTSAPLLPRDANGLVSPGFRVVHVIVPERLFNYAKAQAYLSGLRFPDYVARLLDEARPFPESALPLQDEPADSL